MCLPGCGQVDGNVLCFGSIIFSVLIGNGAGFNVCIQIGFRGLTVIDSVSASEELFAVVSVAFLELDSVSPFNSISEVCICCFC